MSKQDFVDLAHQWAHQFDNNQEQEIYKYLTKKFHETGRDAIKEQSVNNLLFELTHDWRKLTPTQILASTDHIDGKRQNMSGNTDLEERIRGLERFVKSTTRIEERLEKVENREHNLRQDVDLAFDDIRNRIRALENPPRRETEEARELLGEGFSDETYKIQQSILDKIRPTDKAGAPETSRKKYEYKVRLSKPVQKSPTIEDILDLIREMGEAGWIYIEELQGFGLYLFYRELIP